MSFAAPLQPADLEQAFTLYRLSRMLHVATELGIAGHLASGALDAEQLARRTHTHAPTLAALLDALASWGVFLRGEDGRYALNAVSTRLVPGTENAANVPFLLGWAGWPGTYEAFGNLMHTVRTGACALGDAGFHGYLAREPEMAQLYDRAMDATHDGFRRCADAYDFSGVRTLVDVGGGQGAFCLEILRRYPALRAQCVDLPQVVAKGVVAGSAPCERLTLIGGDAMESLPGGADLYVTSTVLRCFADAACLRLLRSVRAAMGPRSKLAAFEMVLPDPPDDVALCTANVVARAVYGGRDRNEGEFRALLAAAGMQLVRTRPATPTVRVLEAIPV